MKNLINLSIGSLAAIGAAMVISSNNLQWMVLFTPFFIMIAGLITKFVKDLATIAYYSNKYKEELND